VTAESDVSGQQSLLQDMLSQGDVDGLVYAATDAKALADITNTAKQQGTTVVNMDSGTTPQPPDVPVFATNNVAAAEQGTDLLAQQLGDRGKVAFIEFQPGTSTNETRGEGFKRGMAKHPGLQLVAQQSSDSDYNTALQVTQDILTANPDLNGIYAANEPSVLGAAEAVRQSGKAGQVKIIGWDTSDGQIQALQDGVITGLIAQNPFKMGYASVETAIAKARGQQPAATTDTGSMMITKENLGSPEVQKLLNPDCANPPQ
jgi:ribose transport system substrate-binding protein